MRTQSLREKQDYDIRIDALLDYIQVQSEEIRELRVENAVLRSLVPDDVASAILLD